MSDDALARLVRDVTELLVQGEVNHRLLALVREERATVWEEAAGLVLYAQRASDASEEFHRRAAEARDGR